MASVAGCGIGQPNSFAGRSEKVCQSAIHTLADETPVTEPVAYAMDRFTELDRILVAVTADGDFPGGTAGQTLRADWITPARTSLKAGWPRLDVLHSAVTVSAASRLRAFDAAARIGETGVRAPVLRGMGLPMCAQLFTAPAPRLSP